MNNILIFDKITKTIVDLLTYGPIPCQRLIWSDSKTAIITYGGDGSINKIHFYCDAKYKYGISWMLIQYEHFYLCLIKKFILL